MGVVEAKSVKKSSLHVSIPLWIRLNIVPFVLIYGTIFWAYFFKYDEWEDMPLFVLPFIVLLNILAVISCYWSVHIRTFFTCRSVKQIKEGVLVKIVPRANKGSSTLVPVEYRSEDQKYFISWRKRTFFWNEQSKQFQKIKYPIDLQFEDYLKSQGYHSESQIKEVQSIYDSNKFDIPMPEFLELYKEQALAPFFIFQLFCVLLWCLDEYWYYSILTLVMLLIFEGTIVFSRLRNLKSLRNMIQPAHNILVYRGNGNWKETSSYNILPGDICSIVRQKGDTLLPCDFLLLNGSCVVNEAMLTGESTPQLKESIQQRENEKLNCKKDRLHILFGGTNVINHSAASTSLPNIGKAPDGGAIGYVLRTGFETNQGKLIRTILFSTDRVTANNLESLLFILFLLIFALAASGYVLVTGWDDPSKSRYKLIVECSLIITSVVPPELPMELSLAVNTSLVALAKLGVFCTEPFRIPFCGKTQVCCFDKTGTLTTDKLNLIGISIPNDSEEKPSDTLISPLSATDWIHFSIAACNSLMFVDNNIVGDPMEVESLNAIKWAPSKGDIVSRTSGPNQKIKILHRFHFESSLKRMSTIASTESNNPTPFATMKGAPETVMNFLKEIPPNYIETYKYFSRQGYRVISLAYKTFSSKSNLTRKSREEIESDLIFCGFLVFDCPIKPDSPKAIQMLKDSSHDTIMITGDNTLTACKVAETLKMIDKTPLILEVSSQDPSMFYWNSIDESVQFNFDEFNKVKAYDLCISGESLKELVRCNLYTKFLPFIKVYARVSPEQKEFIVVSIKNTNKVVLMCGDGTNDVGALKQAQVGVALLNTGTTNKNSNSLSNTEENNQENSNSQTKDISRNELRLRQKKEKKIAKKSSLKTMDSLSSNNKSDNKNTTTTNKTNPRLQRKKPHIGPPTIFDDEEMASVKLGDASIASPFTAKGTSVTPIIDIIRQGRCTLVTTLQMFMILALNCLISAYSMSVLYYEGFKMGDT